MAPLPTDQSKAKGRLPRHASSGRCRILGDRVGDARGPRSIAQQPNDCTTGNGTAFEYLVHRFLQRRRITHPSSWYYRPSLRPRRERRRWAVGLSLPNSEAVVCGFEPWTYSYRKSLRPSTNRDLVVETVYSFLISGCASPWAVAIQSDGGR